jgi:hypothetical protein
MWFAYFVFIVVKKRITIAAPWGGTPDSKFPIPNSRFSVPALAIEPHSLHIRPKPEDHHIWRLQNVYPPPSPDFPEKSFVPIGIVYTKDE